MRLKELRSEYNYTQNEVAKAINTSQRNIGRWENGDNEPTASFIVLLADFFKVSIDYLMEREDDFGNIVVQNESANLSAEEQQLIEDYRTLNYSGKKLVKQTVETLRATSAQSEQKKKA